MSFIRTHRVGGDCVCKAYAHGEAPAIAEFCLTKTNVCIGTCTIEQCVCESVCVYCMRILCAWVYVSVYV